MEGGAEGTDGEAMKVFSMLWIGEETMAGGDMDIFLMLEGEFPGKMKLEVVLSMSLLLLSLLGTGVGGGCFLSDSCCISRDEDVADFRLSDTLATGACGPSSLTSSLLPSLWCCCRCCSSESMVKTPGVGRRGRRKTLGASEAPSAGKGGAIAPKRGRRVEESGG